MNVLLLTSCNRIKQVLLSLSINAQIIEERFSVVIVDSSTPGVDAETACAIHQSDDPYNVVKPHNYCSDVDMLYDAAKWFPQIENFKVIHFSPRLDKQRGEANSIALGLMQAAIIGDRQRHKEPNFCLKLTGTSILVKDMVSTLPTYLADADVLTWHRANIGGSERSTRIFGCRPNVLSGLLAQEGWADWCDDATGILEQRFPRLLDKALPGRVHYTGHSEDGFLLEGGMAMQDIYGRVRIEKLIDEREIHTNATPWLKEFAKGGIWE